MPLQAKMLAGGNYCNLFVIACTVMLTLSHCIDVMVMKYVLTQQPFTNYALLDWNSMSSNLMGEKMNQWTIELKKNSMENRQKSS